MSAYTRPAALAAVFLVFASSVTGCVYGSREVTERKPGVTIHMPQREYTYPDGRYVLRGDGTSSDPYYWVWIPNGVQGEPNPPPVPPLPPKS